jgi:hypothetical protein
MADRKGDGARKNLSCLSQSQPLPRNPEFAEQKKRSYRVKIDVDQCKPVINSYFERL